MPGQAGRTVSTCAIWAATACILIFSGLYRVGGDAWTGSVVIACTALVTLAAGAGTITVLLAPGKRAAGGEAVHLAGHTQPADPRFSVRAGPRGAKEEEV